MPEKVKDATKATDGSQTDAKTQGGTPTPDDASQAGSGAPVTSGEGADGKATDNKEPDSFSRDYVESLREENKRYRLAAKRADTLQLALARAWAESTNKLINAEDLPWSDDYLDDDGNVSKAKVLDAVDALLRQRPYLASRRPAPADLGQGTTDESENGVSFGSLLRGVV